MSDIFDDIPTIRDGQIVSEGHKVRGECDEEAYFVTDGNECADGVQANVTELAEKAECDVRPHDENSTDESGADYSHASCKERVDDCGHSQSDNDGEQLTAVDKHVSESKCTSGTDAELYGDADGSDGVEIISADEAEVIFDYPDTSEDVDIEPKYRRLVDFYLTCGNKKKAAELAGFNASTDNALRVMASRAFKREDVKLYYKLKSQELSKKADISLEAYMAEIVSIATFDIRDVVETEKIPSLTNDEVYVVRFKNIEDIPEFARKAVKSIEIAKDGTPKMVFYDKLQALKLLGEIKGYLEGSASDEEDEHGVAFIPSVDVGEGVDLEI